MPLEWLHIDGSDHERLKEFMGKSSVNKLI